MINNYAAASNCLRKVSCVLCSDEHGSFIGHLDIFHDFGCFLGLSFLETLGFPPEAALWENGAKD